jgi:hypothetical protein
MPDLAMVPTPPRMPSSCRSLLAIGQLLSLMFRSSLTLLPDPACHSTLSAYASCCYPSLNGWA